MKNWKACERKVAEILGGVRVPVTGRQRGTTPDIAHPTLSIEVKSRKSLPAWLEDAMQQAEASSEDGRIPVAVLHEDRKSYRDALVIVRLEDFANNLKGGVWHEPMNSELPHAREEALTERNLASGGLYS